MEMCCVRKIDVVVQMKSASYNNAIEKRHKNERTEDFLKCSAVCNKQVGIEQEH